MESSIENDLWKEVDRQNDLLWRIEEAKRVAGLSLERAVNDTIELGEEVVDTIGLGMRRKLWQLSYFFDGYEDVYGRIKEEDHRMKLNLMDLKNENKRKFISRITEIYVDEVFKGNEEKEKERIYGKILKFSAKVTIGKSIKLSVSAIIAEAIYLNLIKKTIVKNVAKRFISGLLNIAQFYGYYEKASISANRLKITCPQLYWALYFQKLEMLYFIVEPELEKGIYLIEGFRNKQVSEEEVARVLAHMMGD
ncbi:MULTISPECIES: hypothetical protein [Photorhabdus]|uniref:hypothetical protein n=1 Tax=Photorhabdus TaxID=29487 RepID=UPI000DCD7A02|nr:MULTISPECIES: hypothetical protein [Photorhabdus]MCT8343040.1 hypothetical protein [Photorhabdus kleinii]RAW95389.1 hypothetical protein CKY03_17950 [Photorhabdus sp. S9-53]RAW95545.1 hypothetical protein CKY05_17740 [Photorhabdus sp. S10-54]RAW99705.1 hypothetical protein CKY04_17720 [Photorhabdus sp. S8-52]